MSTTPKKLAWPTILELSFCVPTYLPTHPWSYLPTYLPPRPLLVLCCSALLSSRLLCRHLLPRSAPQPTQAAHAGKIARQPPTRELFLSLLFSSSPLLPSPLVALRRRRRQGGGRHPPPSPAAAASSCQPTSTTDSISIAISFSSALTVGLPPLLPAK